MGIISDMVCVSDLLAPGAPVPFRLLAGPPTDRPLGVVTSVDALDAMENAPVSSVVVVPSRVVRPARPYELDIAIRRAAQRDLTAVVLLGTANLPITVRHLADRAELPVLAIADPLDVAEVLLHLDRVTRDSAADSLARAQAALAAIREREPSGDVALLLTGLRDTLGVEVLLLDGETAQGEPIRIDGRDLGALDAPGDAAQLILPAAAAAIARMRAAALAREIAPGQSRSDLLTELVVADRTQASRLVERARVLGLPVDGQHVAIWVGVGRDAAGDPQALAARRHLLDTMVMHVLRNPRTPEGHWNVATVEDALLILGTSTGSGHEAGGRLRRAARELPRALLARHPGVELRCGLGTAQPGLDGLRTTTIEARAASAGAVSRGAFLEEFDATGVQRILAEAAASTLSRRVVDELLEPLDALDPSRSLQAVETLAAYLDAQRSPRLAAKRLNLHYNAVSYRVRRIVEILGADLDDPETRFALHLACRLRLTHLGA
ncbi:PucR family transcriptional regulator [Rhizohabitans arisaemae]|uniref:PucR family transcriptional regulator n=1 Tax=Rhizohabitans arisaemae TaxID=2720610 RepID=UPI0024B0CAA4|nr:helix-turn-helix domain-containing protein [Rhizohabitans arisaemae]